MHSIHDDFTGTSHKHWTQTCVGSASLSLVDSSLRMIIAPTTKNTYADAQIDDYGKLARANFPWRPPLRMEVRARSSHPVESGSTPILNGTAGFGFWNYPFSVRGDVLMLPEAIWFFYASPPSDMALVPGIRGWGWKAQMVHSMRTGAMLAVLPTALTTMWGRITHDSRSAAYWLQRLSGTSEALLSADFTTWHTYTLEWHTTEARFWVDNVEVLRVPNPPTRPLGFVAWLDNQYAVATPQGVFRFGTVACNNEQWVEMDSVSIDPL
jgi:Glycosyl hydrolases family 16